MTERTLNPLQSVRFSPEKATVTELCVTTSGSIAVWGVKPGQEVPAHLHPDGQDTWVMLRGELTYFLCSGELPPGPRRGQRRQRGRGVRVDLLRAETGVGQGRTVTCLSAGNTC